MMERELQSHRSLPCPIRSITRRIPLPDFAPGGFTRLSISVTTTHGLISKPRRAWWRS